MQRRRSDDDDLKAMHKKADKLDDSYEWKPEVNISVSVAFCF